VFVLPARMPRKRATPTGRRNTHPERDLQKSVVGMLRKIVPPDIPWTAVLHGVFLTHDKEQNMRRGKLLKDMGLNPGWADIQFIWKQRLIAIELKADGRLSDAQKDMSTLITLQGGVWKTCRSVEEVVDFLETLGMPLKKLMPAERAVLRAMALGGRLL